MARELKVVIVGDASQLNKTFGQASTGAQTFGQKMENVGATMRSVGKHMAIAGGIITGVSVVVGKKLVDAALAAEQSEARLDKAFENAGLSSKKYAAQITGAEKAGRQLGFTNIETLDSFTKLIQSGDSVSQAMTDMGLAQDYARATGRDLATATSSIVKVHQGLLRPLKELGISLPQITDHMKALTAAHKESGTAITAQEKALAFQQDKLATGAQAVQLMTDKLHGQAAAFSETSAGGMAAFQAKLDALEENLGKFLLPFLDKAVGLLNRVADAFSSLSPNTQKIIVDVGLAVAAFGALLLVVGPVVAAIGSLLPVIVALASPIGLVVVAIAALIAVLVAAVLWPDKLQQGLQRMGLSAKDAKSTVDALRNAFTAIKAVVDAVWPAIQAIVVPALQVIRGILIIVSALLRGDFSDAWRGIKIVIENELKFIVAILTAFPKVMLGIALDIGRALARGILEGAQDLLAYMRSLPGKIVAALGNLSSILYNAGVEIIQGLINGITAKLGELWGLVGGIGGKIAGLKGPIEKDRKLLQPQGSAIIEGLIAGMKARLPDLEKLSSGIGPSLSTGTAMSIPAAAASAVSNVSSVIGGSSGGGMAEITIPVYIGAEKVTEVVRREMLRFEKRNGRSAI